MLPIHGRHRNHGVEPFTLCKLFETAMNKRWRIIALWLLPVVIGLGLLWQAASNRGATDGAVNPPVESRNVANGRMTYGRFLESLQEDRVRAVDVFDGGRTAIVETTDPDFDRPQRLRVELPGLAPNLLDQLKEKRISFDVHPPRQSSPVWGVLGICCCPCCSLAP